MAAARALVSATRMGVVEVLARDPRTAAEVAAELDLDVVGVEALLAALVALGYAEEAGDGTVGLSPAGGVLVEDDADSVAHLVGAYCAHAWEMLGGLDQRLRGELDEQSHQRPADDAFWESYIRGMYELTRREYDRVATDFSAGEPRALLDIGGGHAGFAMAMCRRHDGLTATVLDLPGSVAVGRRIVAEAGFGERITFREGDAVEDDLGTGFDVVSAFNLLHHLPVDAARALLRRTRAALRDGGLLLVGETERREQGEVATVNGAMSGLVYYVSSGTRNYSRDELLRWIEEAGFGAVEVHRSETSPWRLLFAART